jgi:signal transduction histidine kinase
MKRNTEWLFYLLIAYVLCAGIWWSYLLYIKNQDALDAKKAVLWAEYKAQGGVEQGPYFASADYQELTAQYQRQQWMILGEGAILLFFILLGIGQIYRSRQKERALATQQQNFLLSITHELKSPLASIQLILQTIQKRQLQVEQLQRLSDNGLKDTDRLHKLVQDLLLAAKMEGGYQYHFEELNFSALVAEQVDLARHRSPVPIVLVEDESPVHLLAGDYSLLQTLVSNLLDNAIKYGGGQAAIRVQVQAKRNGIQLRVEDGGLGIPKEERERIFEKFYRSGDEHTRKTKGTGLGLFIVQKIAQAHQGRVWVQDAQPQGSIFVVELPNKNKS